MGRGEEAEIEIGAGLELVYELGAMRFEPFLEETLAEVALCQGDMAKALKIAEKALKTTRELNAMSFIGPWLLSTTARATTDPEKQHELLVEGETLLAQGCVGHNYYRFYSNAIEASLMSGNAKEARRYAGLLAEYTREEPTPWSEFFIDRAHALADVAEGGGSANELERMVAMAKSVSHNVAAQSLEDALKRLGKQES
jgi:hypothetical protein